MSLSKLLGAWRADPHIGANIIEWRTLPARPASAEAFPSNLHPVLAQALQSAGISSLYTHQVATWRLAATGKNIIIVTGTASGKTLAYNLPVLDRMLRSPEARALYLFPTKALTQDQFTSLGGQINQLQRFGASITPDQLGVYDGDTPARVRQQIRRQARLVFSNPDMLHMGILPHHTRWAEFFSNLHWVILDEAHIYRGIFGSHVANVIRRLRRVASFYGSFPQFILTSATIGNPLELANHLVDSHDAGSFNLVDQDGAPKGMRHFLIYNPPIVDPNLGIRRSALQEATRLASDLREYNIQSIIFARTRRSVELTLSYLQEQNTTSSTSVRGYRSGYLPGARRQIEKGLRQGQVGTVIATNALELGIDIGRMDASLLIGFPGSIASILQQSGRAGRSEAPALAVMVATADPLDQYIARHPEYIFDHSPENALVAPDNLLILLNHLRCAAFELPFRTGDGFGSCPPDLVQDILDFLTRAGDLHHSGDKYFWIADAYPAQSVSLRSTSPDQIVLQVTQVSTAGLHPDVIGMIDWSSALWMVHPDAVYLHEGQSYRVINLDLEAKIAHLEPVNLDYYTEPRRETTVTVIQTILQEPVPAANKTFGEIDVTTQVIGYRKLRWHTREQLAIAELDLPPSTLRTTAFWVAMDTQAVTKLEPKSSGHGTVIPLPNEYGSNWPKQKALARQRDNYTCQSCGVLESGRAHDVHHKTPFRLFSSPLEANQLENLVTLCPSCHRLAETAVRVRSGLAGLGYALGRLAPLFLMCDPADIGVHTDPQSLLADGQPVVLLYDQVPAGIGLSQNIYHIYSQLLEQARQLVSECPCQDGCPSCVGPGGENGAGGKQETLTLLDCLTAQSAL